MQISCSNFRLKLCQKPQSYKICRVNQAWEYLVWVRSKKLFPETIVHKIFETNSSVMWNSALQEKFNSWFSGDFYKFWHNFDPRRMTKYEAIILWTFEIFLIFPNFLRSQVMSRSAAREPTYIYQFITNNHTLFHLWWKENFLNDPKFWKYYENDCTSTLHLEVWTRCFRHRYYIRLSLN